MDRNQGSGRKRRRRRTQDQPGGGPRELRRGGGETVGGAQDWHQRSRAGVWRTAPSDLVDNGAPPVQRDGRTSRNMVTMRSSANRFCIIIVSHTPTNPASTR